MAMDNDKSAQRVPKRLRPDEEDHVEDAEEPMEADFLFNDPDSEDYDGILAIIQGYIKKMPWEPPKGCQNTTYGMIAELIAEQPNLGTLIKTENDEGDQDFIMAVLSILNIRMYQHLTSIIDPIIAIANKHASKQDVDTLTKILTDQKKQVGLLVNERLGNIPTQLIGSLHQCLHDDLKWSIENADDEQERTFYRFTHLIGISRAYTDDAKTFEAKNMTYLKPEERIYCEDAIVKFMWNTGESNKIDFFDNDTTKAAKTKVVPEVMMLFCVPMDRFKGIVHKIAKTFA